MGDYRTSGTPQRQGRANGEFPAASKQAGIIQKNENFLIPGMGLYPN
jgi:hypothetical protein